MIVMLRRYGGVAALLKDVYPMTVQVADMDFLKGNVSDVKSKRQADYNRGR